MPAMHFVKRSLARLAAPMLRLDGRISTGRQRYVLCYHRVIPASQAQREWVHEAMWVSPQSFDAHIRWMLSIGEVVSLDRLLDFQSPNQRPLFALTFDDGWRDNLVHALPIIRRHRVPATVYLATSFMDDGRLIWPEDLTMKSAAASASMPCAALSAAVIDLAPEPARLPRAKPKRMLEAAIEQLKHLPEYERERRLRDYFTTIGAPAAPLLGQMMTWEDAAEMQRAGVDIGSHSHTHRIFSEATPEQIESELRRSRSRIREELNHEVRTFAYPNARYRGDEGEVLARAGYRHAFRLHNLTVQSDVDPYFIPRFIADEVTCASPAYFKFRLLGLY
jgi:peptidoglycan/xylan/chitin deacetylase (PgdA/CDA1 family)